MRVELTTVFLIATLGAVAQTPAFEAASVKAADPKAITFNRGGPGSPTPTLWVGTAWPLNMLIARAWRLSQSELAGPASMESARYDVTARMPPNTSADDFNLMLQALLKERIGLQVHHEFREQPVYRMSIAKGGLKGNLKEAAPLTEGEKARAYSATPPEGGYRLVARMFRFSEIVKWWERFAQRPIVDETGLSGNFDLLLEIPLSECQSAAPVSTTAEAVPTTACPPKFTFTEAVQQQLGLKLEPGKAKVDVLVVDRFDRMPEN